MMKFESSKIIKIGKSQLHNDLQLTQWIFENLDESVRETIEKGNLYLWIYAQIFLDCLKFDDDFSAEVDRRLHDTNYITTKMAEYDRRFR